MGTIASTHTMVKNVEASGDFKVADMSLADFGRKEMDLAEFEMPGLMATRKEYGKPFAGKKISGSLHMTIQTAVLIETLAEMGADGRWCSCNIFSTQDHAAAAVVKKGTSNVFAWKGESLEEYWWCTDKALKWPDGSGPMQIVDDGGDATLLIHEGFEWENKFKANGELPDPASTDNAEFKCVLQTIKDSLQETPTRWHDLVAQFIGVSEETTTGVHRLIQMAEKGTLLFPANNVNGCRHSLTDGIMRATDVMISGKRAIVCGFGDVGKGCAQSLKVQGAVTYVSEIDPICALQACMDGYIVTSLDDVIETVDIVITATGNKGVLSCAQMSKMKNNAIVANIGHFDNEIDMEGLEKATTRLNIKPQVDKFIFPTGNGVIVLAEGRLMNLGCATGHPSFVMSNSFTNQSLAQIELWKEKKTSKYTNKVYLLSKELDEKVAQLHIEKCQAKLTILSNEQADYIGVPKVGPFKPATYRY